MSALEEPNWNGPGPVVVAYDGSSSARRALLHAAAMVHAGMRITVVHVIPAQSVSARLETVTDEERRRQSELLREAEGILARRGIEADLVRTTGDPLVSILAAVEDAGAGTLVVGRSAHRFPLRASLDDRLVRRAQCDVLVVH